MSTDAWLKTGTAVWVVVMAILAATLSWWLLGAVIVGASFALVEYAVR